MRRLVLAISLLLAVACGGGSSPTGTTPPPPSPPPGTAPASIAIQAGDGQLAEPGAPVAIRPAVIVKDASGTPLPGVTVNFAVDSGGGSLSATSAVTGSNGVATVGTWTLGGTEGRNTIKVTVGTLSPIKIVAIAVVSGGSVPLSTIGTNGGTSIVTTPGPLNGFSISVPGGAFTTSLTATVSYASSAALPHSTAIIPISPLITISTATADYAAGTVTIHIPASVPAGDFPVIVVYDPSTGAKELLTTTTWDANGVSAITRTLSGASMLGTGSLRARASGASLMAGGAEYFVGALPTTVLMADYASTFLPGNDDWEFPMTQTEVQVPINRVNSLGTAATALWYFSSPGTRPKLNGRFMQQPGVPLSDRAGIRWAAVIGNAYDVHVADALRPAFGAGSDPMFDWNQFLTMRAKFAMGAENGAAPRPQFLELTTVDGTPFYMIVYRVAGNRLYIADPGSPGDATRFLEFSTGATMTPYVTSVYQNTTKVSHDFTLVKATSLGLSALVPLDQFPVTYAQVLDGSIGAALFPNYELHGWAGRLYDTLFIVDTLRWWVECANCTNGYATTLSPSPASKVGSGELFTLNPVADLGAQSCNGFLASTVPSAGNDYRIGLAVGSAPLPQMASTLSAWLDWHVFTLRRLQTGISPSPLNGGSGVPLSMTFQVAQNLLPSHVNYVWDFGDQRPAVPVTVPDNPAVKHTYSAVGTYTVTARIVDTRNNQVIGQATTTATITVPQFAWQFTSVAQTGSQLPPGGIKSDDQTDQQILGFFNGWVNNLQTTPRNSEFFIYNDGNCQDIVLEMWPAGQFQPMLDSTGTVGKLLGIFGLTAACDTEHDYNASFTMGTLGSGTLITSAADIPKAESLVLPGGSINATMTGTTLSGTFTWRVRYANGEAVYSFSFTATQVLPAP